jgi:SAM-dependent methyltransferase
MVLEKILTKSARRRMMARLRRMTRWPPLGRVEFGDLRRLTPISREWGYDRGQPIDRYYIECFLSRRAGEIRGHVLEIGTEAYTRQFGGDRVLRNDVLHVTDKLPGVTLVADLTEPDGLSPDTFDCVILTQALQQIYDVRAVLTTVHRVLKPGGVLLLTVPGISQVDRAAMDQWGDYWRFTTLTVRRLLEDAFPETVPDVEAYGNVFVAVAFLEGVVAEELLKGELDYADPDYEILIGARVAKRDDAR